MGETVQITHYKVIWEARKEGGVIVLQDDGGAQHEIRASNPAALAALMLTLRSESDLIFEPSGEPGTRWNESMPMGRRFELS